MVQPSRPPAPLRGLCHSHPDPRQVRGDQQSHPKGFTAKLRDKLLARYFETYENTRAQGAGSAQRRSFHCRSELRAGFWRTGGALRSLMSEVVLRAQCPYSSQNGKFVRCPQASQAKHKLHACRGTGAQTPLLLMWQSRASSHTDYQNAEFPSLKKSKSTVKMSCAWGQGQRDCIPSNGAVLPFFWERIGRNWDPTHSVSSSISNLNVQPKKPHKCLKQAPAALDNPYLPPGIQRPRQKPSASGTGACHRPLADAGPRWSTLCHLHIQLPGAGPESIQEIRD